MSVEENRHEPSELYDAVLTQIDEGAGRVIFNVGGIRHGVSSAGPAWWTIGTVGRLRLPSDRQSCGFLAYPDQRLRRSPADDDPRLGLWGWQIADQTFVAKAGIVPGKNGMVILEDTEMLVLEIPREFIRHCQRYGLLPATVLRGFIADLCELMNWNSCPREDGYSSNGSDERRLAREYFARAYGWLAAVNDIG